MPEYLSEPGSDGWTACVAAMPHKAMIVPRSRQRTLFITASQPLSKLFHYDKTHADAPYALQGKYIKRFSGLLRTL